MTAKERQQIHDAHEHLLGSIDRAELWCIAEALIATDGCVMLAAELLGIYRGMLQRRMRQSKILQTVHRQSWKMPRY